MNYKCTATPRLDIQEVYDSIPSTVQNDFLKDALEDLSHEDSYPLIKDTAMTYDEWTTQNLIEELFDPLGFDAQCRIYNYIKEIISDQDIEML